MEKKVTHSSPILMIAGMFLLSGQSIVYFTNIMIARQEDLNPLVLIVGILGIGITIASIVMNIKFMKRKENRVGDEFTTKIMQKAGFYCLYCIVFLIFVLFMTIYFILGFNKDSNINALFDVRVLMGVLAGIQTTAAFLFALLISVLSKKGDIDEPKNKKSEELL